MLLLFENNYITRDWISTKELDPNTNKIVQSKQLQPSTPSFLVNTMSCVLTHCTAIFLPVPL